MDGSPIGSALSALDRTFREEAGRLTASLVRLLGDFDLAEEMVADAVVEALALGADAQIALTLRAVAGLTTAEIARAFVVPEATLAKRLTRAKQKIVGASIAYAVPEPEDRLDRFASVLRVVYLVFNEGYLATSGAKAVRRDLALDAEWLAGLLVAWMPDEPEALGLLALIQLHLARWPAPLSCDGRLVLLGDQDRSLWDRRRIASGGALIERAAGAGRTGPYQLEAAIAAVHCEAPSWEATGWDQLLVLYSMLAAIDSSPVVTLNRAVVMAEVDGPGPALAEVEALAAVLDRYHPYHATRAALLRRVGRDREAEAADRVAL